MTVDQAEMAFLLSAETTGGLDPQTVLREKAAAVRKTGLAEFVQAAQSEEEIGGLAQLRRWLHQRRNALTEKAKGFGLDSPRGMLVVGVPGSGKSLIAKLSAAVLRRPLIRVDVANLFGGIVGESERNVREVQRLVDAVSPCVLWLEELEKAFAGTAGGPDLDSGVGKRVLGSLPHLDERPDQRRVHRRDGQRRALPAPRADAQGAF